MPKSKMTAEKFDDEVARIQMEADQIVSEINTAMVTQVEELFNALDEDQQRRVRMRMMAKNSQSYPITSERFH